MEFTLGAHTPAAFGGRRLLSPHECLYQGVLEQTCANLPYGDGVTCGPNPDEGLYAGLDLDSESGLDHAMFRQYSSTYGRWTTPDPYAGSYNIYDPQSLNRYTYVSGSPLGTRDPSGLFQIDATLCFPACAPPVVSNSFLSGLLSFIDGPAGEVIGVAGIVYDAGQIIGLWGVAPTFHGSVAASQAGKYVPNAPQSHVCGDFLCSASGSRVGIAAGGGAIIQRPGLIFAGVGGLAGLAEGVFADGVTTGVEEGVTVTQDGLDGFTNHLSQFGEYPPNSAMVGRLTNQLGSQITGADANFYTHELLESQFMNSGMEYDAAHAAALGEAGVSPFSLIHPEVIEQFPEFYNSNWRAYWGLQ